jgi:alkylmercury lyase
VEHLSLEIMAERLLAHARCELDELCLPIVHQVSRGKPLTMVGLGAALQLTQDELAQRLLQAPDTERDQQGNLVGWGVTMVATRHRFQIRHQSLFTWCAFDTVLFPPTLGETAQIHSTCSVTGQPITFVATPDGTIKELAPASAVLSLILPVERRECLRETFCEQSLFFQSEQAALPWLAAHPGALILSVEEAALVGSMVASRRFIIARKGSVDRS